MTGKTPDAEVRPVPKPTIASPNRERRTEAFATACAGRDLSDALTARIPAPVFPHSQFEKVSRTTDRPHDPDRQATGSHLEEGEHANNRIALQHREHANEADRADYPAATVHLEWLCRHSRGRVRSRFKPLQKLSPYTHMRHQRNANLRVLQELTTTIPTPLASYPRGPLCEFLSLLFSSFRLSAVPRTISSFFKKAKARRRLGGC